MQLSVIVCTYNRKDMLIGCLDSIARSLSHAQPVDAEIVVVDNASADGTPETVEAWAARCAFPVQLLVERHKGPVHARNCGCRAARGGLLIFLDDDCHMDEGYVANALRCDERAQEEVLYGGRVELGDASDLPLTIKTDPTPRRWNIAMHSARHENLGNCLHGCNMMMRRSLLERVGPFDEFTDNDIDLVYRCYLAGVTIEYVPDIAVFHYHGRKTADEGYKVFRVYMMQMGALYAKYLLRAPELCRPVVWDLRNAAKELMGQGNTFLPEIGFSHRHRLYYNAIGAVKYLRGRPVF
ncbi:MAG TPA: glycosyltransferase family A protein [Stellaceae bacterium]|jgi:GT2 family glycosyltransferase|nr:glycosyltransferase family A protein [Stellaceae bacterium]